MTTKIDDVENKIENLRLYFFKKQRYLKSMFTIVKKETNSHRQLKNLIK